MLYFILPNVAWIFREDKLIQFKVVLWWRNSRLAGRLCSSPCQGNKIADETCMTGNTSRPSCSSYHSLIRSLFYILQYPSILVFYMYVPTCPPQVPTLSSVGISCTIKDYSERRNPFCCISKVFSHSSWSLSRLADLWAKLLFWKHPPLRLFELPTSTPPSK